ncbi:MAG: hypothetical protein J0I12_13005 [Candidatus Eremiobacteraeota bacterium]|nr:hypothetical protein [Candidatus Eremiobacteraeota bacterium]
MISTQYSSLIGAAPSGVKRPERNQETAPQDGFRASSESTGPGYGPMRFAEEAAEVKKSGFAMPWRGVVAGTLLACSLAGGVASAASAQTMPSSQDVKAQQSLEFLDHAGRLYQAKGGLLGGYKSATTEEAFKQLKSGNSVYWNQAEGQARQTIKNLQSLDQFVESVKHQSLR